MRTKLSFVIIATTIVVLFTSIFLSISISQIDIANKQKSQDPEPTPSISPNEKDQIDNWILKNNLNPYGDPYDSVYTGGTPLFDETTGQKKDRFQYILEQHPDRPWK